MSPSATGEGRGLTRWPRITSLAVVQAFRRPLDLGPVPPRYGTGPRPYTRETKVSSTPEKKVVEEEKKEVTTKETPTKEVMPAKETEAEAEEEVDEDSKASENGNGKEAKENGSSEEKETDEKEAESTNGDSLDAAPELIYMKRKSTGADVTDDVVSKDVASPPKKAKLEEKPVAAAVEAETNGDA